MPKAKVHVYIDHREKDGLYKALHKVLKNKNFAALRARVQWRTFGSADVRIAIEHADGSQTLQVVIERKTASDLLDSFLDGRLQKQKERLLREKASGVPHVCFLIEGTVSQFLKQKWKKKNRNAVTWVEGLANDLFRNDGFHILHTASPERTVREIQKWFEKSQRACKKGEEDSTLQNGKEEKEEGEDSVVTPLFGFSVEPLTPKQFLTATLSAIPGVRKNLARVFANKHHTLRAFLRACRMEEETLEGTSYECGGKKCKLGKVTAKRMEETLGL